MAAVVEANGGDLRSAQRVMAAAKRRTPLVRDLRTSTENIRVAASMRHGHPRDDGIPRRRVDRPRASWEEIMKTSARIGIVILGLMSLGNVPSILTTDGEHPPMAIAAVLTFLGIAGLVLTVLAWRGNRSSLIALSRPAGGVGAELGTRIHFRWCSRRVAGCRRVGDRHHRPRYRACRARPARTPHPRCCVMDEIPYTSTTVSPDARARDLRSFWRWVLALVAPLPFLALAVNMWVLPFDLRADCPH